MISDSSAKQTDVVIEIKVVKIGYSHLGIINHRMDLRRHKV